MDDQDYHHYGSSALGRFATWKPDNISYTSAINPPGDTLTTSRILSQKEYEVKDHLGNVRLVFSDLKDTVAGSSRYKLDIRSVNNYYPFGMLMPDMSWQSSGYRYGYNGMEMDNDVKGTGNSYDYGARLYDPRGVRFIKPDPKESDYPNQSSYVYAGNNPILFIDKNGENIYIYSDNPSIRLALRIVYKTEIGKKALDEFVNNPNKHLYITTTNDLSKKYGGGFRTSTLAVSIRNSDIQGNLDNYVKGGVFKINENRYDDELNKSVNDILNNLNGKKVIEGEINIISFNENILTDDYISQIDLFGLAKFGDLGVNQTYILLTSETAFHELFAHLLSSIELNSKTGMTNVKRRDLEHNNYDDGSNDPNKPKNIYIIQFKKLENNEIRIEIEKVENEEYKEGENYDPSK